MKSTTTFARLSAVTQERGFELSEGEIWGLHYPPFDFDDAINPYSHFTPLISDDASERTIWTGYGINARHVHVVAVHARNAAAGR
ncbi:MULTISPECIES: hypothetical protein [Rhizobium]|uniref:Uncharacterized protein n=1 Tax=Rhizobium leguminosarum bv. viciae TaxID=387 RepID=A0A8G2IS44_RHILV|nr:hypothetical protein [Rhizobium leguminosarum]MBB4509701.1 hypothetical protein [Rhizobium leguminosarum]NEI54720.1 hypothetical protein [Rhizobium leguminosarum]NEI83992.1 hypothetical protein [Rhizobium leguminosarum]NKK11485.1 hypothetical protein [Rhizobium leguminosarum bv. viciae]NKK25480.1 hypothetical protein [Rhizobium leguminosarum bv. viciae]